MDSEEYEDMGQSFTTVIMNKRTGEIINTYEYKQVMISFDKHEHMEENLEYEKNDLPH